MLLWLRHFLSTHKYGAGYFIRMAHQWKFGRDCTPHALDEHALLCGEMLPPFVVDFIHHLQEVECSAPSVKNPSPQELRTTSTPES